MEAKKSYYLLSAGQGGGSFLLSLLIQILTSPRNTLQDTPRNSVLPDIWASVRPVELIHEIKVTLPHIFIDTFSFTIYSHCLLFQLLRQCNKLSQNVWIKTMATFILFIHLLFEQALARRPLLNLASAVMLRLPEALLTHVSGCQ